MNNLNASGPPPGVLGAAGHQGDAGNNGFASGLDPRFFQPGQQNSGTQYDHMAQQIMASLPPEQRATLMGLPRNELALKLKQLSQAGNNATNGMAPQPMASGSMPLNAQALQQAQQQTRQRMLAAHNNPRIREAMDNMEVPKGVFQAVKGIPVGLTKWGELKAWLPHAIGVPDEIKVRLHNHQFQQFQQQAGRNPGAAQLGRPRPPPEELARFPVTPQDMQQMRASHGPLRDAPDAAVRQYIQTIKWTMHTRQNANMAGRPQPGQGPMPTPAAQPGVPPGAPQVFPPQGQPNPTAVSMPESQASARPIAQPNKSNRPQQQQQPTKPASQNQSPAGAVKNLKRPMENDTETSAPANGQRPASGAGQSNMDSNNLSEAQLATLTPEQRQILDRKRHLFGQLARIMAEESKNFDASTYSEFPLRDNPQSHAQFLNIAKGVRQIASNTVISSWFVRSRDEQRLRSFFRTVS